MSRAVVHRAGWFVCLAVLICLRPAAGWAADPGGPELPDCRYPDQMPAGGAATSEHGGLQRFPADDLFRPVLADPKQPQFVISRQRVNPDSGDDFVGGWVVYGETFGIYRYLTGRPCRGVQVDIQGAVFAQFNVSAPSSDLVNADYVVGLPFTFRVDGVSGRLRVYHQSSHLGDELLLGSPGITRVNLSFEELEALLSYDWKTLRVYGGAGRLIHFEPDLAVWRLQYGAESRVRLTDVPILRVVPSFDFFVIGADFKQFQEHGYDRDLSVKAGFELTSGFSLRRFRLLFDFYNGFNPFGQFYDHRIRAAGVEVNFGF
jgi:hypothetical protein